MISSSRFLGRPLLRLCSGGRSARGRAQHGGSVVFRGDDFPVAAVSHDGATQGIPAVSPIFGNNAAFVVMSVDSASDAATDYVVHTLTNLSTAGTTASAIWSPEYDYTEVSGVDGLSANTLGGCGSRSRPTRPSA